MKKNTEALLMDNLSAALKTAFDPANRSEMQAHLDKPEPGVLDVMLDPDVIRFAVSAADTVATKGVVVGMFDLFHTVKPYIK